MNAERRIDLAWMFGFVGCFALGLSFSFSFGAFPDNDDWVFANSAEALARRGEWVVTENNRNLYPTAYVPVVTAGLIGRFVGFSHLLLHGVTTSFALIGVFATYVGLRRIGVASSIAGTLGLTLTFNPWYWRHAFTFMTDAPAVALSLVALVCYIDGVLRDSNRSLFIGGLVLALAVWTRQTALATLLVPWCAVVINGWRAARLVDPARYDPHFDRLSDRRGLFPQIDRNAVARFVKSMTIASLAPSFALIMLEFNPRGDGTIVRAATAFQRPAEDDRAGRNRRLGGYYSAVLVLGLSLAPAAGLMLSTARVRRCDDVVSGDNESESKTAPPPHRPLSRFQPKSIRRTAQRIRRSAPLVFAIVSLIPAAFFIASMLRGGNAVITQATGPCFADAHYGPVLTPDFQTPGRWNDLGGVTWPPIVWRIVTLVALASFALLIITGGDSIIACMNDRDDVDRLKTLEVALLFGALPSTVLLVELMGFHFDRYWILGLGDLLLWIGVRCERFRRERTSNGRLGCQPIGDRATTFVLIWGVVALVAFAAVAVVFRHDWAAFQAARFNMCEYYRRDGFAPKEIDGGYEFNGSVRAKEDPATPPRPGGEQAVWWSESARRGVAVGPRDGWIDDAETEWFSWAVMRPIKLYGQRKAERRESAREGDRPSE